jgi:hypothetical protein
MSAAKQQLAVYGDSVTWGQGLLGGQKFTSMIAADLNLHVNMNAHSGARNGIGDNQNLTSCGSESPFSYPTTVQQIENDSGNPDLTPLVIVDGGINDVQVTTILSPFTSPADLKQLIKVHCHDDIVTLFRDYLLKRYTSDSTRFVLTSYFPIFSHSSDFGRIFSFLPEIGIALPVSLQSESNQREFAFSSVDNALLFWTESTMRLKQAVADIGLARVFFAEIPFTAAHSMFTDDSWLFNVHFKGLELVPEDPVAAVRKKECAVCYAGDSLKEFRCGLASAGHPNITGAQVFHNTIQDLLGKRGSETYEKV